MRARRTWIVGYDIASPKRLRRIAKFLEKSALRIQFSLFVGCWTQAEFDRVWFGLGKLINPRCDDVRAWPVPEAADVATIGAGLPEGMVLGEARSRSFVGVVGHPPGEHDGVAATGRRKES